MTRPGAKLGSTRWRSALLLWLLLGCASSVDAQQRADWMLDFQPEGSRFIADFFGSGTIFRIEHLARIYGTTNDVVVGASAAPTYPLGEVAATADLRVLFLGLGAATGYRTVWRNLTFEPGENTYCMECDRGARRKRDSLFEKTPGSDHWGWGQLHARLFMPFNENFVGLSFGAVRWEGRQDRSFDWFNSTIYDRGVLWKWETLFFLKHRDWGGIGPYVQMLAVPRNGDLDVQWAYGFNAIRRLGLVKRGDFIFLTILARPGDDHFGQHSYYMPMRGLINYRLTFDL